MIKEILQECSILNKTPKTHIKLFRARFELKSLCMDMFNMEYWSKIKPFPSFLHITIHEKLKHNFGSVPVFKPAR